MKKLLLILILFLGVILQGQHPEELLSRPLRGSAARAAAAVPGRVGVYFWGEYPESNDPFGQASRDIRALGAKVARTAITPPAFWPIGGQEEVLPLFEQINRVEYLSFISSFEEVWLTAYDAASYGGDISSQRYRERERFSEEEWREYLEEVFQEHARFGERLVELSAQFGTKITVSNWEGANDAYQDHYWVSAEGGAPGPYVEYLKTRLSGLRQGIAEGLKGGFEGRVQTAFEFTLLWQGMDTNPWDEIPPRTISDYEIGVQELKELVDVWSYSAWASVFHIPDAKISVEYNRRSLETAFRRMRQVCADCRIVVGEIGYLHDQQEGGAVLPVLFDTALEQGAEIVFSWVLYDQPQEQWSAFGSYDLEGRITEQGVFLRRLLAEENTQERRREGISRPVVSGEAR